MLVTWPGSLSCVPPSAVIGTPIGTTTWGADMSSWCVIEQSTNQVAQNSNLQLNFILAVSIVTATSLVPVVQLLCVIDY